ncbi:MAG: Gfo/Idh/MocA family oxidoreductase [Oscillospiraceae bacterium]|nr:Gfo/Idh/MocA family oxidoreductase [Oscillospiraceae bacterium]
MQTYKAAIIGCGNIFPMHAVSVQRTEGVELVAICDNKPERAIAAAQEFSCKAYTDYQEMLRTEQIDVVHLCLPHYLHAPVAIDCMKQGVHVLTEKPMAISLTDAKAMIDTTKQCGVTLGCIFQNRYNAGTLLVKEELAKGTLGSIKAAKCFVTWNRSDAYYSASDWKGTWEKEGGGLVIDQAIHTLDMLRYLVDEDIAYVDAFIANRGHASIEVEDTAEGVIAYKSGLLTNFHAINYYSYDADVTIELDCENALVQMVGDNATIKFHDGRTLMAQRNPTENFDYGNVKSYWGVNHVKQISNFYASMRSGIAPYITVESAYKTQEMVCAIYQSGKEGRKIYL